MHWNYLGWAIPAFVALIAAEWWYTKKKGLPYYELHNTVANVSIGIAERLCDVLVAGYFYFIYDSIQKNYGLFQIETGVGWWIILFLLTDFIWYWYHRLAHEMNILWMVHVVHHQSEDYNYSVSARITILQALVRTGFWCVLPLIGFPAPMITGLLILHGLYPFFIHTRAIGKLGFLEYILVTPSHHRVHHASNEKYLDKNYGDVLIIWDKLLGTFQKEEEEPVYGLTKQLNTYSFLWQHFHFAIELWLGVRAKKTWREKWKVIFGKPEHFDPTLREKAESLFRVKKNPAAIEQPLNKYVIIQMLLMLVAVTLFIGWEAYFQTSYKLGFVAIVLLTLINCGAIMEQKKWVFHLEWLRLSLLLFIPLLYYPLALQWKTLLITITLFPLIFYYKNLEDLYYRLVFPHAEDYRPVENEQ